MNGNFGDRFPGATLLGEAEFASAIVGRAFRYRYLASEIVVNRPKEFFREGGQYSMGHRPISHGTYSIERGIVSIDCDCPYTFLGLGRKRVFFRHKGRLLTASAELQGEVIELIPES